MLVSNLNYELFLAAQPPPYILNPPIRIHKRKTNDSLASLRNEFGIEWAKIHTRETNGEIVVLRDHTTPSILPNESIYLEGL